MQQRFSVTFQAPIWQIRPDYLSGLIALEIRDGDRLQTEFSVLEAKTGTLLLSGYQTTENWWVGLEDISPGKLFLHGFGDRRLGTHLGITALKVDTKQVLWQKDQAIFYGIVSENKLLVRLQESINDEFAMVDSWTGTILEGALTPTEAQAAITLFAGGKKRILFYPVHHAEGGEFFDLLSQFVASRTEAKPVKAIDYLETESCFIISYYEEVAGNKLKNTLSIFNNSDGIPLMKVVITEAGQGLAPDSFFLMGETLITIQERITILGYSIN